MTILGEVMKSIGAAKFKENCLSLLDEVDGEGIIITKHGKPVAKLIAIYGEDASLIGKLSKKLKIVSEKQLLTTGSHWNAES